MKLKKYSLFILPVVVSFLALFRVLFLKELILDQDYLFQQVPYRSFIHSSLLSGRLPYIYPYSILGIPLLSHGQIGIFFPITFITLLFGNQFVAYYIELLVLFLIGFFGEYIFSSQHLKSEFQRVIASLYFAFSPFVFVHIIHLNLIVPYMLLPYSLYLLENIEKEKTYIIGLVSVFLLSMIATHPQLAMIHIAISFIYALFLPNRFNKLRLFFISFLFAFFIAAVQLVPFIFMRLQGHFHGRSGLSWMMGESFDPFISWALFFIPFPYPRYGPLNGEIFLYISGAFALLAYFISGLWKRYRIFLYMVLLGIILMIVKYNPIYLLLSKIPLINSTRAHIRWWGGILPFVSIMVGAGSSVVIKERNLKKLLFVVLILPVIWVMYFLLVRMAAGDKWPYLFNIKETLNIIFFGVFIVFSILFISLKRKKWVYTAFLIIEIAVFGNFFYFYGPKNEVLKTLDYFKDFKNKRFVGVPADFKRLKRLFPPDRPPSIRDFTVYCTFFNGDFSYYLHAYNILGYVAPALQPVYIDSFTNAFYDAFYKGEDIERTCDLLRSLKTDYLVSYFPIKNVRCLMPYKKKLGVYIYRIFYPENTFKIMYKKGRYVINQIPDDSIIEVPLRYLPGIKILNNKGHELKFDVMSDYMIKVFTEGNKKIVIEYRPLWAYYGALITFISLIGFFIFFKLYKRT